MGLALLMSTKTLRGRLTFAETREDLDWLESPRVQMPEHLRSPPVRTTPTMGLYPQPRTCSSGRHNSTVEIRAGGRSKYLDVYKPELQRCPSIRVDLARQ